MKELEEGSIPAYVVMEKSGSVLLETIRATRRDCRRSFLTENRIPALDWETATRAGYRIVPVTVAIQRETRENPL